MRERTRLQNSLDVIDRIDRELNDNVELIELGESENDEQVIGEAEKAIQDLHQFSQKQELETLLSGEADCKRLLYRSSCRRRWDGSPRLGANLITDVYALG